MTNLEKEQIQYTIGVFVVLTLLILSAFFLSGCQGQTGNPGAPGQSIVGPQGPQGAPGQSVSVSTQPASVQECSAGGTDILFNGVEEATVCNGVQGQNGTQIDFVQFCPGFTQTYPSTFAESGICVNGQMYGIYSENGGFLALLPPGTYSSDGINASCNFTLGANCEISQ